MRLALVLILLPALLAGRAATASSTVTPGPAGAGSGAVSGYTVSAIVYSLAGDQIDGVSFALSPSGAATVRARLSSGDPWVPCSVAGSAVTCPVSTAAADAVSLQVVAAGS